LPISAFETSESLAMATGGPRRPQPNNTEGMRAVPSAARCSVDARSPNHTLYDQRALSARPKLESGGLGRSCRASSQIVDFVASPKPWSNITPPLEMKRYLVASALIIGFVTPALAEQFYVAFDPASHKCTMMHSNYLRLPSTKRGSFWWPAVAISTRRQREMPSPG
jgi:hypothetical protein